VTKQLENKGIAVFIGPQDGHFLQVCHARKPIDLFVYTSALPSDHTELVLAKKLGIKTVKRDELIAQIIDEKRLKLLAVAGTHGKTTTTGMLVWTLKELGIPVSYSVGSTLNFGPSGKYDSSSEYFVYECDEFDRNFLHFSPFLSIITSVDYDHPDTYPTEEDYTSAFRQFVHGSSQSILWQRDADYIATRESSAWCLQADEVLALPLAGAHNRRNGTLVLKALERLGIGENLDNRDALASFPGTDRRFERLAENLYTDYGHHPVEITATLQMARELSDNVVLVYQPHQNVRQHEIKGEYKDAFLQAETIYWLPTYLSREDTNLPVLTPEELTMGLANRQSVELADLNEELWDKVGQARNEGKLVLLMGAGDIDSWARKKL
jgi:UDP-N-acetylmuramate--alanine ligase